VAIFSLAPTELQRLDWRLLQNGSVSLYFRDEALDADLGWLRENAYQVEEVDALAWTSAKDMHQALATALTFPDHYGRNLDALNDCLSDVDVPDAGGLVLVFRRFDAFATLDRKVADGLLDILAWNARRFLLFGRRLLVLLQSDDPQLALAPVGATPVMWNPREWLDRDRGARSDR
jgi:RNAse (barnase) inhibitor barstar